MGILLGIILAIKIAVEVNKIHSRAVQGKARITQDKIDQDMISLFDKNPEKIIAEVSRYYEAGNFWMAMMRSKIFLPTKNPEIIRLYEQASAEVNKAEDARKKAEDDKFWREWAEKSKTAGYPEDDSKELCIKTIRLMVNNPSTLKIHSFAGYGTNVDSQGVRRITQSFSAKNSFGLETKYDAYCTITQSGETEVSIVEQGR